MPVRGVLPGLLQTGDEVPEKLRRVGLLGIAQGQLSGHSQVDHQVVTTEHENQVFPTARKPPDFLTAQLPDLFFYELKDLRVSDHYCGDFRSQDPGFKTSLDGFDFGKFRHVVRGNSSFHFINEMENSVEWLGDQDSNLDRRLQRPLSYRLDDPRPGKAL